MRSHDAIELRCAVCPREIDLLPCIVWKHIRMTSCHNGILFDDDLARAVHARVFATSYSALTLADRDEYLLGCVGRLVGVVVPHLAAVLPVSEVSHVEQ